MKANQPNLAWSYFSRWRDWTGTSSRKEFHVGFQWSLVFVVVPLLLFPAIVRTELVGNDQQWLFIVLYLLLLGVNTWLGFALVVRRCRDVGWEPSFALLLLVPIVSIGVYVALAVLKSSPNPKTKV